MQEMYEPQSINQSINQSQVSEYTVYKSIHIHQMLQFTLSGKLCPRRPWLGLRIYPSVLIQANFILKMDFFGELFSGHGARCLFNNDNPCIPNNNYSQSSN